MLGLEGRERARWVGGWWDLCGWYGIVLVVDDG